jgi:hypothetical protein
MAYPVYLTIGNIPKEIRRKPSRCAQILVGYIPTTKFTGITNKTGRRRAQANLFHTCMRLLLTPINSVGETGIEMMSGDGIWRRCHPIFAVFVGDYPEQTLVTCTYNGRCPKCRVPCERLGEYNQFSPRDFNEAINVYYIADGDGQAFHAACDEAGLKPVYHPFWESFPLVDIYLSITPDILHQMLQGVMKHLIAWLTDSRTFGPAQINARCKSLPPNHHIALFPGGITHLSRVSGAEHKNMCRILIGLVVNLPLPNGQGSSRVTKAVRALLDFLYLAQLPSHTSETLHLLDNSLGRFHQNKLVFVELGVREHFNIPKFHSLVHYYSSISLFGTTDNYNTEQSERLHIDFAKNAYRASNRKDEYPQMTTWLERREKMGRHALTIELRQRGLYHHNVPREHATTQKPIGPPRTGTRHVKMAQQPTVWGVRFDDIVKNYGATNILDALADFIAKINHPDASTVVLQARSRNTLIPFSAVNVFHKIKFTSSSSSDIVDTIHVQAERKDPSGHVIPSRFDTVLVRSKVSDTIHGVNGKR